MENGPKSEPVTIDTQKIAASPNGEAYIKNLTLNLLGQLESAERKPIKVGELAVSTNGDFPHVGLMVVEIKEDGFVRVSPAPGLATVDINAKDLYHFDDYHEAFKAALVAEQNRPNSTEVN